MAIGVVNEFADRWRLPHQRRDTPVAERQTMSAATRHLSAAAYLDEEFRRACLSYVYYQRRRLVAPSYGFDIVTVLHHCLRAQQIVLARDGLILVVCLTLLIRFPVALLLVGILLSTMALAPWLLTRARRRLGTLRRRSLKSTVRVLRRWTVTGGVLILVVFALLAGLADHRLSERVQESLFVSFTSLGGLTVTCVLARVWTHIAISRLSHQPQASIRLAGRRRLQEIDRQARGNVVAYAGSRPFVGAGIQLDNGSIPLRLIRKDKGVDETMTEERREFELPPFQASELITHVRQRLTSLARSTRASEHVPGLTVTDRVFLAGDEGSSIGSTMEEGDVQSTIDAPTGPARHFLVCQVDSWDGELVTTLYLHIALQGRTLVIQLSAWALAPCDPSYRAVDQVFSHGAPPYLAALFRGIMRAPQTVASTPINLIRALAAKSTAGSELSWRMHGGHRRTYRYGAEVSVRELGSKEATRNNFQQLDVVKYIQIMKTRALAAVLDFLDDHDVDTTEFRRRSIAILNQGVIFSNNPNLYVDTINNSPTTMQGTVEVGGEGV